MAFLAEGAYSASIPDVYGAAENTLKTARDTAQVNNLFHSNNRVSCCGPCLDAVQIVFYSRCPTNKIG
jgi:hypothetical protein